VGGFALGQQTAGPMLSYDDISHPNYRYAVSVSSLHDVDFRDLRVFWFAGERPDSGAKLQDGTFKRKSKGGYEEVHLDLVEFFDSPDGGPEHAVIDLEWKDCGGSCAVVGRVQVFELQSGHPVVVQEIEYDRHAPGTGAHFDPHSKVLTVTGRSSEPSPNCCPKSLDVMTFEWDGKEFIFKNSNRVALADTP